jgi:hypothetical protein
MTLPSTYVTYGILRLYTPTVFSSSQNAKNPARKFNHQHALMPCAGTFTITLGIVCVHVHAIEHLLESGQLSETSATGTALHSHWWIRKHYGLATTEPRELPQGATADPPTTGSSIQVEDLLQNLRQVYETAPPRQQVCPSLIDSAISQTNSK